MYQTTPSCSIGNQIFSKMRLQQNLYLLWNCRFWISSI